MAVAAGVVRDAEGAEASSGDALAVALEANRELSELAEQQRAAVAVLGVVPWMNRPPCTWHHGWRKGPLSLQ